MAQIFNQSNSQQQELKTQGQQFDAYKKMSIQDKINHIVLKISKQTQGTQAAFPLYQIFSELYPLLEDMENFKSAISDDQTKTLYLKYHSFIKQSNKETQSLSKASLNPTPEKMVEIKNRILEMMGNVKSLHNQALMSSKKYILWMDTKQANNSLELQQLYNDYKGDVIIKYYTDNQQFRKDLIEELKDFPKIIILSAAAAGSNIQFGDGDHFQFLKQNKKDLRLRGVVIYCGQAGFDNLKGLLKDESKLLRCITMDYSEMMDAVKNLVVPLDFKRVIPLADLDAYLSVTAKTSLISFSQYDWSTRSLMELHPNKVNYKDIFKRAKDLIVSKVIRMRPELVSTMENIPGELQKLFEQTEQNNNELSKSLMSLYSRENANIPVYNVLNSTLNIMNEDLIKIMQPFIDLFLIALYYYDDSFDSVIQKPLKNADPIVYDFYRGSTIPDDQFNTDKIKAGNFITLPGFSSFSADPNIAAIFVKTNTGFTDSQPVIFNYKFKTGNQFFNNRPKFIDKVTPWKEKEYLVYPFTLFRIIDVIPPSDTKEHYDIVLTIN